MNPFLKYSITYAQQRNYLDDLYSVYHTLPNGIRDIDEKAWGKVESAFNDHNNIALVKGLLDFQLFPLKDSYVAYLRSDRSAIERNPKTVNRIASELIGMEIEKIFYSCSQPKEMNRQMGPMFKNWIRRGSLGFPVLQIENFTESSCDAVLDASDNMMKAFAHDKLGYDRDKGLDFIARINKHYVIGEAKFLTDFGGHQNAQFNDAIATLDCSANAIKIAILDGILYIKNRGKMYSSLTNEYKEQNIMSALLLRNFLNTL